MAKKLPDSVIERIMEMRPTHTNDQIAEALNISPWTVSRYGKRAGFKGAYQARVPDDVVAQIVKLRRHSGTSRRHLAKRFNVSESFIYRKAGRCAKRIRETEKIRIEILATDPVRPWKADAIAAKLGLGETTVQRVMRERNIPRTREHRTTDEHKRARARMLYADTTLTVEEIAAKVGLHWRTVIKYTRDLPTRKTNHTMMHGRRIIYLKERKGLNFSQIAKEIGIHKTTVAVIYRKLLKRREQRLKSPAWRARNDNRRPREAQEENERLIA